MMHDVYAVVTGRPLRNEYGRVAVLTPTERQRGVFVGLAGIDGYNGVKTQ